MWKVPVWARNSTAGIVNHCIKVMHRVSPTIVIDYYHSYLLAHRRLSEADYQVLWGCAGGVSLSCKSGPDPHDDICDH